MQGCTCAVLYAMIGPERLRQSIELSLAVGLDLMLAGTHGRVLSASDLATGAGVPLSSGLRMISALERLGLVHRAIDERDRRRTIVRLTDVGTERMASYFDKVGAAWQAGQTLAA